MNPERPSAQGASASHEAVEQVADLERAVLRLVHRRVSAHEAGDGDDADRGEERYIAALTRRHLAPVRKAAQEPVPDDAEQPRRGRIRSLVEQHIAAARQDDEPVIRSRTAVSGQVVEPDELPAVLELRPEAL